MDGINEATSLGQQLENLLHGVVKDIQREGDMIRGVSDAADIIEDLRKQLWARLNELDRDGAAWARAMLTRHTPPVALIAEQPTEQAALPHAANGSNGSGIKPPQHKPTVEDLKRVAQALIAPNGIGDNRFWRRVQQVG